ncbi:MAG: glycoside hydrolase family 3 protein [Micropruina sp.]|nr:glycoside hydrolase family 3 protein [Micropruina sp.]
MSHNPARAADGRRRGLVGGLVATLTLASLATSGVAPASAAPEHDVAGLVAQMSLTEKFGMLAGGTGTNGAAGAVVGVPRLGIPRIDMADGPAGVRSNLPATALPAPVALGSTFDPELAAAYGGVLGQEANALGMEVLLGPMMNLIRTPFAGRNFETISEDPLLSSALSAPQVAAIQGHGVIATGKHYAANNQEFGRSGINVIVDERTLHETELAAFEAVVDAGIGAVMCSYNQVNGVQACQDPPTCSPRFCAVSGVRRPGYD